MWVVTTVTPLPVTAPHVMVTGHRELLHPDVVAERFNQLLVRLGPASAISGGAQGADAVFAAQALEVGVPLRLFLPNRWYRSRYPAAVSDEVVDAAAEVVEVVDRPEVDDWSACWDAQRWWRDNFARNTAMVSAADVVVVCSSRHPNVLVTEAKGGTAHAARAAVAAHPHGRLLWVPDDPARSMRWVPVESVAAHVVRPQRSQRPTRVSGTSRRRTPA